MTNLTRRLLIIIATALLISFTSHAKPGPIRDQQLVTAEKRVIWEAVAKRQMEVLRTSLAEEYLDVSDVGIFNKSETLQLIPDLTLKDYSLDKFRVIKLGKNAAIVTYEAIQHWTLKGQEGATHVRATSVWINRGGKWLVTFHQESAIA